MSRNTFFSASGNFVKVFLTAMLMLCLPITAFAAEGHGDMLDLTNHWVGYASLLLFVAAYSLVVLEETIHMRKSKPVMTAAGIIWALVAMVYAQHGDTHTAGIAVRHNLLEFGELFLFLLAAMTFINTMDDRRVFEALRARLVSHGFSLRTIFWLTGGLAFVISPLADNLTTALLMATVAMAVGGDNTKFVVVACINIVVAANAGGAFSPFGDITTLMVWQKGIETASQGVVGFSSFFSLLLPSLVNWLVPAIIMSMTVAKEKPAAMEEKVVLLPGAIAVVALFMLTIVMAVCAHNFLHLPPVLGMMTGLGVLKLYGYFLKRRLWRNNSHEMGENPGVGEMNVIRSDAPFHEDGQPMDTFQNLARAEWDTLMFFYGVILCVGGLGTIGYLGVTSAFMYGDLGATQANILVGVLSAIVDNIPVMFAVLTMMPEMDMGQWMLVTLTAGVGGSLLSVGSAAGVAVMGQARGVYTFFAHLKWTWAIALGYAASIWVHFLVNGDLFLS